MYPFLMKINNKFQSVNFKSTILYFETKTGNLIAAKIGSTLFYNIDKLNKAKDILNLYLSSEITFKFLNNLETLCKLVDEHLNQ